MMLIGVHGKARSGKDTLARCLMHNPGNFKRLAFADPLKHAVALLFNIPVEVAFSDDKDQIIQPWGLTLRDILQRFGTESMRDVFGQSFWIDRLIAEYQKIKDTANVVVTDVRFPNEAARIRELGGTIIHLRRDGAGLLGSASAHISETVLPFVEGDVELHNNGSVYQLAMGLLHNIQFETTK